MPGLGKLKTTFGRSNAKLQKKNKSTTSVDAIESPIARKDTWIASQVNISRQSSWEPNDDRGDVRSSVVANLRPIAERDVGIGDKGGDVRSSVLDNLQPIAEREIDDRRDDVRTSVLANLRPIAEREADINSWLQAQLSSNQAEEPRSFRSKLTKKFGKTTFKSDRQSLVDNFTKWDKQPRIPSQPVGNFTKWDDQRQSTRWSAKKALNSPYIEASAAQQRWANSLEVDDDDDDDAAYLSALEETDDSNTRAIRNIDWSQYQDNTQLRELLKVYQEDQPSPVDSGVDIGDESSNSKRGKGKERADEGSSSVNLAKEISQVDKVLALELALRLEIETQQQEWADRAQALRIQKEDELERQRQEEEDRIRARQIQEEEDRQAAEAVRLAAELARLRECNVCGDSKDVFEYPAKTPTSSCEHPSLTCNECLQTWLASEFDTKGCEDLKCPECPQVLSFPEIQTLASEETFVAYEKLLTRNALSSLPDFAWCLSATCTSGQLNSDNDDTNYMDCAACSYKQCLSCRVPWHSNETCQQYQYRTSGQKARDEEAATEAMIDTVSKKCPGKNCGWRIQKTEGCDHMTCKKCKFEFCWECLAGHKEIRRVGNEAHQDWCKFHTKNLGTEDLAWPFNAHR